MYSLSGHGAMIADRVRMDAYTRALSEIIKPGAVVLDIGTGTGIFALLACRSGARKVYAVEPDDIIAVAREIAAANGYAEKIEFSQDFSNRITLAERADVIISDIRGVLPLFQKNIPSIIDARTRLLAPGGVLIPRRDCLYVAVAEAAEQYQKRISFWEDHGFDVDLRPAMHYAANAWQRATFAPEHLVVEPRRWAAVDYMTVTNPSFGGEVNWTVDRSATAHGLALWFDSELSEDASFSNAPGGPDLIYGQGFFPWLAPVHLKAGDEVSVRLHADLVDQDYIWRWETVVLDRKGEEKARFKQSSLRGIPLSPAQLRKRASKYVPSLSEEGRVDLFIVSQMNGENSLDEIARRVVDHFPERFRNWQEALNVVGDLSKKYG